MAELSKKPVRRTVRKAVNSPVPEGVSASMNSMGSTCGHDGCGTACNVRYVGPTSHMRDHHIFHTARGVSQVWTAAIVAGLAVVLTGAIAWSTVEAQSKPTTDTTNAAVRQSVEQLGKRLDRMEDMLKTLTAQCKASVAAGTETTTATTAPSTCAQKCSSEALACKKAATDIDGVTACGDSYKKCTSSCK